MPPRCLPAGKLSSRPSPLGIRLAARASCTTKVNLSHINSCKHAHGKVPIMQASSLLGGGNDLETEGAVDVVGDEGFDSADAEVLYVYLRGLLLEYNPVG